MRKKHKRSVKKNMQRPHRKTKGIGPKSPRSAYKRANLPTPKDSIDDLSYALIGNVDLNFLHEHIGVGEREIKNILYNSVRDGISAADPHRTWLAEIDRIAHNTDDIRELRNAISAYLRQAGISRLEEFHDKTRFVLARGYKGDQIRVTQPAYIDTVSNRTILAGRAKRVDIPGDPVAEHSAREKATREPEDIK
jgi:hypothetical protein